MKNNDNMKHIYPLAITLLVLLIAGCNQNQSATEEVCDNTCPYAFDGDCDDGGPNSDYDLCDCGTDCADCGTRQVSDTDCLDGSPAGNGGNGNGGNEPTVTYGSFTDTRDGTIYRTVDIGNQTWLADNLRFDVPGSLVYDDDIGNLEQHGRLYDWNMALTACPMGWHLPSDAEWTTLQTYLGGEVVAGGKMKTTGTEDWQAPNYFATNSSGFSGYPSGRHTGGNGFYDALGARTEYWSTDTCSAGWQCSSIWTLNWSDGFLNNVGANRLQLRSCRCIQD